MKLFKKLVATFVAGILSLPYMLMAQDTGTYINSLSVQDSSYMELDLLPDSAQSSGSGNTIIIVVVVVVVIAAVAFFFMKKKKK